MRRLRLEVRGAVQGVGFRPFVYRLAHELCLSGWVLNGTRGVVVEVDGEDDRLRNFRRRLESEAPKRARISEVIEAWLPTGRFVGFAIRASDPWGERQVFVLPDIATCPDCLREVLDPADRRHRYPFANCTNCGPRFTIVRALPYDRPNTTMAGFALCPACQGEYLDPLDRRFHAQPTACAACGPSLTLLDGVGRERSHAEDALGEAAAAVREGQVVAVKGLGGFHLVVDATDSEAVALLRRRKAREEKPLALMANDLGSIRSFCRVGPEEEALLLSPEAPIVLLDRLLLPADSDAFRIAPNVAPGSPTLGVMLPATPLHHLLLSAIGRPVVATSGNRSEEPICIHESEAIIRLGGMADLFLVHDRPIERHADDSIARVVLGEPRLLRRARGIAPLPVRLQAEVSSILAVGGQLKNTVALGLGKEAFLSQHLGDLETPEAVAAFEKVIADFLRLYGTSPNVVAHDLHPGYASTRWAKESGLPTFGVQHHHAHLASCLAENGSPGPALGVTWDGTGWGTDGTVWGGEFLLGDAAGFTRVAHLRTFLLPGGETAVREPRRAALALLHEALGPGALLRDDLDPVSAFAPAEREILGRMLSTGLNSPVTSSAGRLFDAVASLTGIRQRNRHEGQAAMELEWAADPAEGAAYPLPLVEEAGGSLVLDWVPLVHALLDDLRRGTGRGAISARFHSALADGIVSVAKKVACPTVALSGGCFLNRLLLERVVQHLREEGFDALLHREVPPGDGGISLGQIAVAAAAGT